MNFKLIAIRPLSCETKRFSKNLKQNKIYKFYNDYYFYDERKNEVIDEAEEQVIFYKKKNDSVPDDLYKINDSINDISIQVSALVGKNGAGKSTILELLYGTCYLVALELNILNGVDYFNERITFLKEEVNLCIIKTTLEETDNTEYTRLNQKIQYCKEQIVAINKIKKEFAVDLFFSLDEEVYNVRYKDSELSYFRLEENLLDKKSSYQDLSLDFKKELSKYLFYTISINYSLYGLNENLRENFWLNALFHKNDGYQTPLVINPFRIEGNIDVNSELHLGQTRVITNCIVEDSNEILHGKDIDSILFQFESKEEYQTSIDLYLKKYSLDKEEFINEIYYKLYEIDPGIKISNDFEEYYCSYIFNKIIKISEKYTEYKGIIDKGIDGIVLSNSFNRLLDKFRADRSHITLKVCQALNTLRFSFFRESILESEGRYKFGFKILIGELREKINTVKNTNKDIRLEDLIPLGGAIPHILVKNETSEESNGNLDDLSSGEQHYLFSINSIVYHILNLNSVFNTKEHKVKYQNVNIVLDEVELYFHPEFQRNLVKDLVSRLQNLNIPNIKSINILLSTHSPFILSDIPNANILKLGEDSKFENKKITSFGANINDILANGFYLNNSNKGAFVDYLVDDFLIFYHNSIIDIMKLKKDDSVGKELKLIQDQLVKFEMKLKLIDDPIVRKIVLANVENLKYQIKNVQV